MEQKFPNYSRSTFDIYIMYGNFILIYYYRGYYLLSIKMLNFVEMLIKKKTCTWNMSFIIFSQNIIINIV